MTINTTPLRSFIAPVWHEISSLWSSVDFWFGDSVPDLAEQSGQAFFVGTVLSDQQSGINRGSYGHCW